MNTPLNTTEAMKGGGEALLFLAESLVDPDGAISNQEARGATEMIETSVLPTETLYATQQEFEALGFKFGEPVEGDPLFRHAELPAGWARRRTNHSMWTDIVDERGLPRAAVFYKAAFYDRGAHMSLVEPWGHWVSGICYSNDPVALPEHANLFTSEETARLRQRLEDELAEHQGVCHPSQPEKVKAKAAARAAEVRLRLHEAIALLEEAA